MPPRTGYSPPPEGPAAAVLVPSLGARVVGRTPLRYEAGADLATDRPDHVRAGSALVRVGAKRLAVIQDDASFVAFITEGAGRVDAVALPSPSGERQFDEGRGNKAKKLDLEAAVLLDGGALLVAFGSGSSPLRERVALVSSPAARASGRPRLVLATELYAKMRAERMFSGAELNVEGAALEGGDVLFFQRGNGAGDACDATARVPERALLDYLRGVGACPELRDVVRWELGAVDGVRLGFTDGAASPRGGLAFLACSEDSPDATRDGPVTGVALGRLDDRARRVQLGLVLDERGLPLLDKCEGLSLSPDDPRVAWVVVDKDDPAAPSELLELRLDEGWTSPTAPRSPP